MYVAVDDKHRIVAASDYPFSSAGREIVQIKFSQRKLDKIVGMKLHNGRVVMSIPAKPANELRVAFICNWNDKCGISTYSKFMVDALIPHVKEVFVFSEITKDHTQADEPYVSRCWQRGDNLKPLIKQLLDWKPDFIVIQHEYGIFPNACHWFKLMQMIDEIPYLVIMHSVYEHLDKAVYSSVCRNIMVHSEQGKQCLLGKGNTSNIFVVPHGCPDMKNDGPLWNILHTQHSILQFGFGFRYKGVERMLEAVSLLKHNNPNFHDIFYTFMLSTNEHNLRTHNSYYDVLLAKVDELNISDNVAIIRKYSSDLMLDLTLRQYKLAVFPYVMSPDNTVYGASGAIRIAMSSGIPVICSDSHLFDDLEGVVPRPASSEELAKQIETVFTDNQYKVSLITANREYLKNNSWGNSVTKLLEAYTTIAS